MNLQIILINLLFGLVCPSLRKPNKQKSSFTSDGDGVRGLVQPRCETVWQLVPKWRESRPGIQQSRFQYLGNCFEKLYPNANEDASMYSSSAHNAYRLEETRMPFKRWMYTQSGVHPCQEEQNTPPQNISLWHKDYFGLINFLKKNLGKQSRVGRFVKDIYVY